MKAPLSVWWIRNKSLKTFCRKQMKTSQPDTSIKSPQTAWTLMFITHECKMMWVEHVVGDGTSVSLCSVRPPTGIGMHNICSSYGYSCGCRCGFPFNLFSQTLACLDRLLSAIKRCSSAHLFPSCRQCLATLIEGECNQSQAFHEARWLEALLFISKTSFIIYLFKTWFPRKVSFCVDRVTIWSTSCSIKRIAHLNSD